MTQLTFDVVEYDEFVRRTSQFADKPNDLRRAIALYGLVGEIGSLVAAVKKKLLSEDGEARWDFPNEEIKEEIGDVFWYCYSSAQTINDEYFDILAANISALHAEIGNGDERAQKIATSLNPDARISFLEAARTFPSTKNNFDDYQRLAYKTARTEGRVLLEVCLAVLWQLGAELLRATLPEIETTLNKGVVDRDPNIVLGEITWHLSAVASLYHLSLDDVIAFNTTKVSFRSERGEHTPLHDEGRERHERFPRVFDVAFVHIGAGRSRMYLSGKPLGNDLTDNSYEDDGYRFHDVLHLALVAHLGWSPVVRKMMERKRKSRNDKVDQVEDGGRAQVVEELILKAIHTEGERQARADGRCVIGTPTRMFPTASLINFRLLKTVRSYVEGLEVARNTYWEWEDAILEGCDMYYRLCEEKQGTVHVDLNARKLSFSPEVCPAIRGLTVGLGMASVDARSMNEDNVLNVSEYGWATNRDAVAKTIAAKRAILDALGMDNDSAALYSEIEVRLEVGNKVYVKLMKSVQQHAWMLRASDYKIAFASDTDSVICTATAIADVVDVSR